MGEGLYGAVINECKNYYGKKSYLESISEENMVVECPALVER